MSVDERDYKSINADYEQHYAIVTISGTLASPRCSKMLYCNTANMQRYQLFAMIVDYKSQSV